MWPLDRAGEFAEKYFRQGQRVLVRGRIQTGSYVNRDGQKIYTTDVVILEQEFAESRRDGGGGRRPEPAQDDGFMNIPDGVEDDGRRSDRAERIQDPGSRQKERGE